MCHVSFSKFYSMGGICLCRHCANALPRVNAPCDFFFFANLHDMARGSFIVPCLLQCFQDARDHGHMSGSM